jgi:hypothetical protein
MSESPSLHAATCRPLTPRQRKAAQLIAADEMEDQQIAALVGVTPRAVAAWKIRDDFKAEVNRILAAYNEKIQRRGIALRMKRVERLNDLHERSVQVIEQRAQDPALAGVPGGNTGMVVKSYRNIVNPKTGKLVGAPVHEYDTGIVRSILDIEKQAALELGQLPNETPIGAVSVTINQNQYNLAIKRALGLADDEVPPTIDVTGDQLPAGVDFDPKGDDGSPAGVEP